MKHLAYTRQRACFVATSWQFDVAMAHEATRLCNTLGGCAGLLPRLISDAYLMGGEL